MCNIVRKPIDKNLIVNWVGKLQNKLKHEKKT